MAASRTLTLHDKVLLSDGDEYRLVTLSDIRFFETCGNYSVAWFNGSKLIIYKTLSYLDSRLSKEYFFRANRQYMVNITHIQNVELMDNSVFRLEMSCGQQIDLSRRRSKQFKTVMAL
ncbi:MAG: LytTR family DNA-binding domain-containing protein [Balneolaceae bacterium]